jgi:hypothetical protein
MSAGIRLVCFNAAVLGIYRQRGDCVLRRTDRIGRLETPRWTLEFRVAPGDQLQLPERDLWKMEPAEAPHWYSFQVAEYHHGALWCAGAEPGDGPERPWP